MSVSILNMESIRIERTYCGFDSLDDECPHDEIVDLTLDLKPTLNMKNSHLCDVLENEREITSTLPHNEPTTKSVNVAADDDCKKTNTVTFKRNTFSLDNKEKTAKVDCEYKKIQNYTQSDYLLDNSGEDNLKNEFAARVKCALDGNEYGTQAATSLLLDISDNLTKIAAFSNINPKDNGKTEPNNHLNNSGSDIHEPNEAGLQTDYYDENNEGSSFSAELHMICENEDFFSEHDILEKEYFTDNSCHHTTSGSDLQSGLSSTSCATHLKENTQTNMNEEFHNDQYESIEFSTIFSSCDIYQRPLYHNYATENASHSQENNKINQNVITDLNNQSCEKSLSESEVFDLPLNDTKTTEFLQSDEAQYSQQVSSSDKCATDLKSELNNSILFKLDDVHSTPAASVRTNSTSFPDPTTNFVNCLPVSQRDYNASWPIVPTALTVNQNAAALSLHYSQLDKLSSESPLYDPCLSDYDKNYQKCLHHSPQNFSAAYTEWSPWVKGTGVPYDINTSFICSNQVTNDGHLVSTNDTRANLTKPDFVQFMQMEAKEDEEETDDADEIDYLPITFSTSNDILSQHMESVGTTVYTSENSNAVYGPLVLTPPPSTSSTPVPSCSQDCGMSDDMDLLTHWPASHFDKSQVYCSSSCACKLKREQLESGLLSFGLKQCTKRPFPSMADVMHNSRSRKASQKRSALEAFDQQPRRSGRPRKTQIQSDKISTTAINSKLRKKASFRSKCESIVNDGSDVNSPENKRESGRTRTSGTSRHNEPLNQRAIEIMTQWFENHIDNPYPTKADKEKMATQGGITENQVKSWFANKRNRTNNTKPKVQKRAMEEKLKEIFRDLKRNNQNPLADNSHVIQQLSGIIQRCHSTKQE